MDHILNIITYIPLAGALVILFFVNKNNTRAIRDRWPRPPRSIDFIVSLYLWLELRPRRHGQRHLAVPRDLRLDPVARRRTTTSASTASPCC